jgi:coenzyme F420-reducing hydrogenase gamma subunit
MPSASSRPSVSPGGHSASRGDPGPPRPGSPRPSVSPGAHSASRGNPGPPRPGSPRPKLAVWKFASCDGCQLTLLNCEDELLTLAAEVEIAHFTEASSAEVAGPYDVSLVEGSITTQDDAERLRAVRAASRVLVTIGACATSGGIQALRNFADVEEFTSVVYARPEYVSTLATSTAIAEHVPVDFELRGCPIDRRQLLELLSALLAGRKPRIPAHSVCYECKQRGTVCVMVAHGTPCLGPVTQAGCGAICPAFGRGCYGCFGPAADPDTASLTAQLRRLGMSSGDLSRVFSTFNAASPAFAAARDAAAADEADAG